MARKKADEASKELAEPVAEAEVAWPEGDDVVLEDVPEPVPGQALTPEQRHVRNMRIVQARLGRGLSWPNVAATYRLSERACRTIVKAYRDAQPSLKAIDPIDTIEERLFQLQGAAEELALVAQTADNDSARIGAIKARLDALAQHTELLQAVGVLPNELGRLRVEVDVRVIAQRVLAVVAEMNLPAEQHARLLEALTGQPVEIQQG